MAKCGDSWWPRLPSSDSDNRCISGIWLTAGDSQRKAAVCSLSLCVTVTAAGALKGNLLSVDLNTPCLYRVACTVSVEKSGTKQGYLAIMLLNALYFSLM